VPPFSFALHPSSPRCKGLFTENLQEGIYANRQGVASMGGPPPA
jgi:hypothetical protein